MGIERKNIARIEKGWANPYAAEETSSTSEGADRKKEATGKSIALRPQEPMRPRDGPEDPEAPQVAYHQINVQACLRRTFRSASRHGERRPTISSPQKKARAVRTDETNVV